MRQFITVLTFATVLLVAATTLSVADAKSEKTQLSVDRQHSHNAKRVKAKLHHLSGARSKLVSRQQRLTKGGGGKKIDARTPAMKATQAAIAKETAEIKAKIAQVESRKMSVQQASSSGAPSNQTNTSSTGRNLNPGITAGVTQFFDAPHCAADSKFRVLETRFHDICARTDMSFVTRHWFNLTRANSAYNKFCTSACAGTINDLLQHTVGYTCFESDVLTELRLFSTMCQYAPATQIRCGAEVAVSGVFDGITSYCESPNVVYNETNCRLDPSCQWESQLFECMEKVTVATITKECTDCYVKIVDVVSEDFNSVCAKQGGEFCLPKMFEFNTILNNYSFDFSKDMIAATCKDPLMVPCFRSQDVGLDNYLITDARETFERCIDTAAVSEMQCSRNFQSVLQSADTYSAYWSQQCALNTTVSGAGPSDYCYRISQDLTFNCQSCPYSQANSATCDTTCTAQNTRFLQETGCCAAYVDYVPRVTPAQFPVLPFFTPNTSYIGRVDTDYYFYNVSKFERCTGTQLFNWTAAFCPNPWSVSAPITMWTILNYTAVQQASPAQRDKLLFAMKLDIGKAAGVMVNALSVTLSPKTIFVSGGVGVTGTDVNFTIRGSPSFIDAAATQWDVSAPHRVMTRSDEEIRGCRTCKPDTEASIVPTTFPKIPGAPVDPCNSDAFYTDYSALISSCSGTAIDALLSLETANLPLANLGWNLACGSTCLAQFRTIKAGPYKTCVPTEVSTLGDLINVGCTKDKDNNRCGAVLTVMAGEDCSVKDQAACGAASGTCRWNVKTSECKEQFSEAFLKPKCDSGCINRLAATVGMNGDKFGKEARTLNNLFCSHDNGTLCLPMVQNQINVIDEKGLTTPVVNDICGTTGSGPKLRCMKRVFTAIGADTISFAEEEFYYCVERVLDDSSISHHNKIYNIETDCIQDVLAATISYVDGTTDMLNNMCSQNSNGEYCMQFPYKYENSTCIGRMLQENVCPVNCVAAIDAIMTDIGCCAGNLQEVEGFLPFAYLPVADVPEYDGLLFEDYGEDFGAPVVQGPNVTYDFQGPQPGAAGGGLGVGLVPRNASTFTLASNEQAVATPKWFYFANYVTCVGDSSVQPKFSASDLVYKKCKKVRGSLTETRTINLGVAIDSVASESSKEKRFSKKTQIDIGIINALVGDDLNVTLAANPNSTIALPAGFGTRRATTSSATTATITMQASTNEDTAASAAAYDSAVASNTLTLTSTIALVKNECNNCTTAGADYTSVSTTATALTLTAEVNAATGAPPTPMPISGSMASNSGNTSSSGSTTTASGASAGPAVSIVAAVLTIMSLMMVTMA